MLETNLHFPTDLNLLWDSTRKCLDVMEWLLRLTSLKGWRKIKHIHHILKDQFRKTSNQVFKGKNEVQKKQSVKEYLGQAKVILERCEALIQNPPIVEGAALKIMVLLQEFGRYCGFLTHIAAKSPIFINF